jgi:rfaE bifunctional protein kinase chain/domain
MPKLNQKHSGQKDNANKTVFVFGDFDVLHPGHIRFLKFAKEQGLVLIVGIYDVDFSSNAYVPNSERKEAILSLTCVDDVVILESAAVEFISEFKPNVVVKGKEWQSKNNPELAAIESYGGKLIFGSGETTSTKYLSKQIEQSPSLQKINSKVTHFIHRNDIDIAKLNQTVKNFSQLKIAVLGDIIVDEYISCEPVGMSREDPTIVVRPLNNKVFVGGAGIVAKHASGLNAEVDFYSVTGTDELAKDIESDLAGANLTPYLFRDESRPTTKKTRYRAANKTMLRVNDFRQHDLSDELIKQVIKTFKENIQQYDLVVFSDFNYGFLCRQLVSELISIANSHNVPMVADSQSSSQVGDLTKFIGMNLVTPTEHEARITLQDSKDGLIKLSETLGQALDAKSLFVTLGEDGVLIRTKKDHNWMTDEIPAINKNPTDVAGAGDAMLISASLSLQAGANIWEAALIGSLASAAQVAKLGNVPLRNDEITGLISKICI